MLIVDDDESHRSILKNLLENISCQTLEADDGKTGLQMAIEHQPDVILLDLNMPNMDGFELMVALQAHAKTASIPIIVSSANVFDENRQRSLKAGAKAFVPKPLDRNELLAALQSAFSTNVNASSPNIEWVYAPLVTETPPSSPVSSTQKEMLLPAQEVLQELYHLAMMGDIPGIEGMIENISQQNTELVAFVSELRKLTTNFQTGKIRKFIKSLIKTESDQ
jgi:CheY-like chemotaxis protein